MDDERARDPDPDAAPAYRALPVFAADLPAERWIFAYGSLIWRPGFDCVASRTAVVRGWRRRFWQASPDHRGIPEAPGRVVTLVAEPEASCWGLALLPRADDWAAIMGALDRREQNGYERVDIAIEFEDGSVHPGVTYVAPPCNPSFVGPARLEDMVAQILAAVGPSGPNLEYVLRLADVLERSNIHDEEVHTLRDALARAAGARPAS